MQADGAADAQAHEDALVEASPAVAVRMFGWTILALLAAFLTNVILTFWFDFPGIYQFIGGTASGSTGLAAFQLAIYLGAIALALGAVSKTSHRSLRQDEKVVSNINAFLIRAAFYVVLFVGLSDAILSFLRVEGMLEGFVGEELAGDLGRSAFRGPYVHVPFVIFGIICAYFTRTLGFQWLTLLVVVAELMIVISRFIFSYEQAFMADLVRFWYGALFLFASAYTLLDDGHVRVDLIYASLRKPTKGKVNKWGAIFLGIPLCWTILLIGMWAKSSVIVGPILVFEVTQAGFGLYVKYFMAGFLGIFATTMLIQFVAQLFSGVADSRSEKGGRPPKAEIM